MVNSSGLSRRRFLKIAATGAAGLVTAGPRVLGGTPTRSSMSHRQRHRKCPGTSRD